MILVELLIIFILGEFDVFGFYGCLYLYVYFCNRYIWLYIVESNKNKFLEISILEKIILGKFRRF